jgi:hypothetical protein
MLYTITNTITNTVYVGRTKNYDTLHTSWSNRRYDALKRKRNDKLSHAIRIYGIDKFKITVLPYPNEELYYKALRIAHKDNTYNKGVVDV